MRSPLSLLLLAAFGVAYAGFGPLSLDLSYLGLWVSQVTWPWILPPLALGSSYLLFLKGRSSVSMWELCLLFLGYLGVLFMTTFLLTVHGATMLDLLSALSSIYLLLLPILCLVYILYYSVMGYGHVFRAWLPLSEDHSIYQMTLGGAIIVLGFGLLGLLGAVSILLSFGFLLIGVLLGLYFERKRLLTQITHRVPLHTFQAKPLIWLAVFGAITIAGFHLLHVLRPFPIGWDDLHVYMYVPNLIAESGGMVQGFGPQLLSYFYAGLLGIGIPSYGIFVLHVAMSVGVQYTLTLLSDDTKTRVLIFFLTIPFFLMFQMASDLKPDMMGLFFLILPTYWLFRDRKPLGTVRLLLSGLCIGVAIMIKWSLLLFLPVFLLLLARREAWLFFLSVASFLLVCVLSPNVLATMGVIAPDSTYVLQLVLLFLSFLFLGMHLFYGGKLQVLKPLLLSLVPIVFLSTTWLIPVCTLECSSSQALLFGTLESPDLPLKPIELLHQDQTGREVELQRYQGENSDLSLFLQPFHTVFLWSFQKGGVVQFVPYVHVGILVPLLMLLLAIRQASWKRWTFFAIGAGLFFGLSYFDLAPEILLLLAPLLYLVFVAREEHLAWDGLLYLLILWIYIGTGVPWYALSGMLFLIIALRVLPTTWKDTLLALSLVFVLLPSLAYAAVKVQTRPLDARTGNVLDTQVAAPNYTTFVLFQSGAIDMDETLSIHNAPYSKVVSVLNEDVDAYIYQVGTMLPYFLERSFGRIRSDNQLDQFAHMYATMSAEELRDHLLLYGFTYIVYDPATATIGREGDVLRERDENFRRFLAQYATRLITAKNIHLYSLE